MFSIRRTLILTRVKLSNKKNSDDSTNASSNNYFIMKEIMYDFVFVSVCEISVCVLCI